MTIKKRKIKKSAIYFLLGIIATFILLIIFINTLKSEAERKKQSDYKLKKAGYNDTEIAEILKLDEEFIKYLSENEYNSYEYKFMKEKYFIKDNMDEYLKYYKKHSKEKIKDIIAIVNVNKNEKNYENYNNSNPKDNELILINKHTKLDQNTEFDDLVDVKNWYCYGSNKLRKDAYEAFIDLYNAAKEEDLKILIKTSYRSYDEQQTLWDNQGGDDDDLSVSKPGFSDYQSGYSVDLTLDEEGLKEHWLNENAYKYGFILRYPKGKENITGYAYNKQHYRYVGTKAAKIIHDEKITFDEYYEFYVANKK